jgi:hypothetical protein
MALTRYRKPCSEAAQALAASISSLGSVRRDFHRHKPGWHHATWTQCPARDIHAVGEPAGRRGLGAPRSRVQPPNDAVCRKAFARLSSGWPHRDGEDRDTAPTSRH